MKRYTLFFILILTLISCQNREWTNPFDPNCPKEIWTPTDFKAVQEGSTVKLTWSQPIPQISGFKIQKAVDGGLAASMPDQAKGINQLVDNTLIGGKNHSYSLTAYAGNNLSNTVTMQITPLFLSSISLTTISTVKAFAATLSTAISADGGAPITVRGICWNTAQNPTISNSKTNDGTGAGSFTSSLTGLSSSTTYYARSYATNSVGTAYGTQVSFTTNYGEVTDIEGNIYQTVKIGTQIWTAENLKTTRYKNGVAIPLVTDNTAWSNLISPGYSWYNNDVAANKNVYGALYNWYTVNTNNLCPIGWHVPTDPEWTTLTTFLGGESVAGGSLKESGIDFWYSPNTGATNISGFTALPGGFRINDGTFSHVGFSGIWWSSTAYDASNVWYRAITYGNASVFRVYNNKQGGNSVRCVSGELTLPSITTTQISSITTTSAMSGGNITSDGGTLISARGVCLSTTASPTIANSKTIDGSGMGNFASSITGLTSGTTYFVRAYATSNAGTAYGSQVNFTTIANQITPTFAAIGPLCQNSTPPGLPLSSTNNPAITGTWSPATISTTTAGTSNYTFTPAAGQNANIVTMTITIIASSIPAFAAIGSLCQNSAAPVLPTTSTNGIIGTWAPSIISTTTSGTNTYTFTPAAGQCATGVIMGITITNSITPTFASIGPLIQNSTAPVLQLTSTNGITGTWAPSTINTSLAGTITYTFTPNVGQCVSVVAMDIVTVPLTVTDVDGNVYHAIAIGTQVWMVENLKTTKYRNGDQIPNVTDGGTWAALTAGGYCWFQNYANTYGVAYGGLYNWYAVADSRNLAPTGWHVATDTDWTTLTTFLGGEGVAGGPLKATSNWISPNTDATNSTGFTALPGGYRDFNGLFYYVGNYGHWWCLTESTTTFAWARYMGYSYSSVGRYDRNKLTGFSVRCVLD